ncbi:MAG: hypothetical protein AAFY83_11725, partial [Pseudomonadota bacterium]
PYYFRFLFAVRGREEIEDKAAIKTNPLTAYSARRLMSVPFVIRGLPSVRKSPPPETDVEGPVDTPKDDGIGSGI